LWSAKVWCRPTRLLSRGGAKSSHPAGTKGLIQEPINERNQPEESRRWFNPLGPLILEEGLLKKRGLARGYKLPPRTVERGGRACDENKKLVKRASAAKTKRMAGISLYYPRCPVKEKTTLGGDKL